MATNERDQSSCRVAFLALALMLIYFAVDNHVVLKPWNNQALGDTHEERRAPLNSMALDSTPLAVLTDWLTEGRSPSRNWVALLLRSLRPVFAGARESMQPRPTSP